MHIALTACSLLTWSLLCFANLRTLIDGKSPDSEYNGILTSRLPTGDIIPSRWGVAE